MSKPVEVELTVMEDGKIVVHDIKGVAGAECTSAAKSFINHLREGVSIDGKLTKTKTYSKGTASAVQKQKQSLG